MKFFTAVAVLWMASTLAAQDPAEQAQRLEEKGDATGARQLLQHAANAAATDVGPLVAYAEFLERYRDPDTRAAYEKALACDPISAFGGVIVVNRPVDDVLARLLSTNFVEVLWAPGYTAEALDILTIKKDIRILTGQINRDTCGSMDMKRVYNGMLVQDWDCEVDQRDNMEVVTTRHPSEEEWGDLLFAWRVAKHTKSNAIILAKDLMTIGVGAGQMSRVDSANLAVSRSRFPLAGSVVASDAYFPFPDALEVAINAGATAVIHPGGSKRDDLSRELAESRGMAMVITGRRHFRH